MKHFCIAGNIAAGVALLAFSTFCRAQNEIVAWDFPDFSATQVFQSTQYNMSMKVWRSGSSVRMERSAAWTTLYMPSTGKTYNLTTYPDKSHQCVVLRPEQVKMLPSPLDLIEGTKMTRTPAGNDLVEGHPCKVETVVVTRIDGKSIESKVWEAQDLQGIPVKIESKLGNSTLTAVYHDIVIGAQDNALFTPPEKCTPFEKMGQVVEKVGN